VVKVLEPFEVRACNTTSVYKHIWGADNATALEDLFGSVGCGSVGTLEDGLAHNLVGVALV